MTERFTVERVDVSSNRSFADTVAAFHREVPAGDLPALNRLIDSHANAHEIETRVAAMVGDLGFMILAELEQGPLVSLLGKPKKMIVYLVGNPVLANRMYEQNPAIGLYAPLRVSIYEDYGGRTHLTYEKPSTSLAQFDSEAVRTVAEVLDGRMASLASRLVPAT